MARPKGYVTRQAKRLSDGEINRRRFVMSMLSAGVTMPTALSLASRAEARVPKRGGTLRMALAEGSPLDTLDPARADNGFTRSLSFARGNALTEVTAAGEVIGELAESFEVSPDARHWAFTLRRDVTFHDGAPLTTGDVLATFARPHQRALLADVADMRASAPHQIMLELSRPDPDFARRLADPRLIVLPARADPEAAVATGPYRLERFAPGRIAELTRNPDYWKPGRAHFDAVKMIPVPDVTARQTALMTGEADYADMLDPRGVALLRRVPSLAITETAAGRHLALSMRTGIAPFDNARLRSALASVLPGQALVDRLLLGHGSALGPAPDPARAARLFRRSGHVGPVPLAASDDPIAREAARLIARHAAEAGIDVAICDPGSACGWLAEVRRAPDAPASGTANLLRINDISGHALSLTNVGAVAANHENDGARLAERWWFS